MSLMSYRGTISHRHSKASPCQQDNLINASILGHKHFSHKTSTVASFTNNKTQPALGTGPNKSPTYLRIHPCAASTQENAVLILTADRAAGRRFEKS